MTLTRQEYKQKKRCSLSPGITKKATSNFSFHKFCNKHIKLYYFNCNKKKKNSVSKDKVRDRWRNKSLPTLPWEVLGLERKLSHPRKSPWETSAGEASAGVSQAGPGTGGDAVAGASQVNSSGNTTKTSAHLQWIIISFAFTREWNQLPAMAAHIFLRYEPHKQLQIQILTSSS